MKKLGCGLFLLLFIFGFTILYNIILLDNPNKQENLTTEVNENDVNKGVSRFNPKELKTQEIILPKKFTAEGIHSLIGISVDQLKEKYGDPTRIDLSAYDYQWWIYPETFPNSYIQVGVQDDKVVTIFCIGADLPTANIKIGADYDELNEIFHFQKEVSLRIKNNSYQFKLTEEELYSRPLLNVDGIFIQLYFDTLSKTLSSIRYIDASTLVKQRPYSVVYRGALLEAKLLTDDQWRKVEKGSALQIFAITNEIRKVHQLPELSWDDETSIVAYYHSKDMKSNEYFSHSSPSNGELKDRLKKQGILYQMAGENIAAKYVDAIAAVEGWLNSEGHRVNLLHESFTHIGVGVYEKYYTQNFITPWE